MPICMKCKEKAQEKSRECKCDLCGKKMKRKIEIKCDPKIQMDLFDPKTWGINGKK